MVLMVETIRDIIDAKALVKEMRKAGYSEADANMIVDMALKGVDDSMAAFHAAMELLPIGAPMTLQAATVGLQLMAWSANSQHETLVNMASGAGMNIIREARKDVH